MKYYKMFIFYTCMSHVNTWDQIYTIKNISVETKPDTPFESPDRRQNSTSIKRNLSKGD